MYQLLHVLHIYCINFNVLHQRVFCSVKLEYTVIYTGQKVQSNPFFICAAWGKTFPTSSWQTNKNKTCALLFANTKHMRPGSRPGLIHCTQTQFSKCTRLKTLLVFLFQHNKLQLITWPPVVLRSNQIIIALSNPLHLRLLNSKALEHTINTSVQRFPGKRGKANVGLAFLLYTV